MPISTHKTSRGFTPRSLGAAYTPESRKCVMRLVLHADAQLNLDVSNGELAVRSVHTNGGDSWYDHVREIRFSEFAPLEAFKYQTISTDPDMQRAPPPKTPVASASRQLAKRSGSRTAYDTAEYILRLRHQEEEAQATREQGIRIVLLGLRCLGAFHYRDVPHVMQHLKAGGSPADQSPIDTLHHELQLLYEYSLEDAEAALEIMADCPMGEECLRHLYFGGWTAAKGGSQSYMLSAGETLMWLMGKKRLRSNSADYSWDSIQSMLDVRAFLTVAYGRVALNSVYSLMHMVLVIIALVVKAQDQHLTEFYAPVDLPMAAYLVGAIVEEATQFWMLQDYLKDAWNLLDVAIILSQSFYFAAMGTEAISRFCLGITPLFLLLRVLAAFRNSETMPVSGAGTLIRTTIAMLQSICGFLLMFMYVIVAFAVCFYFIFHGEFDDESRPHREEVRRLHFGGGSSNHDDAEGADPFATMSSVFLWLFHAVLGDFRYTDMHGSKFEVPGIVLLTVFLLVSSIILLNFMIAILSGTYERHEENSRRLYLLDLGKDALTLAYHPSMSAGTALPTLPRPANLVNIALRAIFVVAHLVVGILFCCCKGTGVHSDVKTYLHRIHFQLQLLVYFIFGNLVMVAFTMLCRLWVLFFFIVGTLLISPFSCGCFLVNLGNGSLWTQWAQFSEEKRFLDGPNMWVSTFIHILAFIKSLRFNQIVMLSGPATMTYLIVVSFLTDELSVIPGADWALDTIDVMTKELSGIMSQEVHGLLVVERKLWSLVLHGAVVAFIAAFLWELVHPFMICLGGIESSFMLGWFGMLSEAKEHYKCPASKKTDEAEQVQCALRKMLSRSRSHHVLSELCEVSADAAETATYLDEDVREYLDCVLKGEDCGDATRPAFLDMHNCLAMFVAYPHHSQPLIRQAVMFIYNIDEAGVPLPGEAPVDFACHRSMAMYISLEDWYWVVDSLAKCMLNNWQQLRMSPRPNYVNMDELSKERLRQHPLVGLYCIPLEDGALGVFFEDFFWALYQGSFFERYCRIDVLVDELWDYTWRHEVRVQEVRVKDLPGIMSNDPDGDEDMDAQLMESLLNAASNARQSGQSHSAGSDSIFGRRDSNSSRVSHPTQRSATPNGWR